jgi:hypothetical protein
MLKNIDLFGYQVKLNVDKDNKSHKTVVGAVASLIYLAAFIWVFIQCLGADLEGVEADLDPNLRKGNKVVAPGTATAGSKRRLAGIANVFTS